MGVLGWAGSTLPNGRGSERLYKHSTRLTEPRPSEAVKELRFAGETACATKTSPVLALVGQTVSSALPPCGISFTAFEELPCKPLITHDRRAAKKLDISPQAQAEFLSRMAPPGGHSASQGAVTQRLSTWAR